jgi:hypothetical protein
MTKPEIATRDGGSPPDVVSVRLADDAVIDRPLTEQAEQTSNSPISMAAFRAGGAKRFTLSKDRGTPPVCLQL